VCFLVIVEEVVLRAHVDARAPLQGREEHRGDAAADAVQRPPASVPVPRRRWPARARSAGGAAAERGVPPRGRNEFRREGWHPSRRAKVNAAMAVPMAMAWRLGAEKPTGSTHL
jgi:hypothetical protein